MALKRQLIQFVIINETDCNYNLPLFQANQFSINANTKYSWDITSESLSCGTATIVINSVTLQITFQPTLAAFLSALNALGFGFFCTETLLGSTYLYTADDVNIYGGLEICGIAPATTTSTTTTSTTSLPITSSTTTTTTAAPIGTSTTTTTTTAVPVGTSSTTTTTTAAPVGTSSTTTTTTAVPVGTSSTTTTTTAVPVGTSSTTTTTTAAPISTSTTTTTTTATFYTFSGVIGKSAECCPTPINSTATTLYSNCNILVITTCSLFTNSSLTNPFSGRFTFEGVCYETDISGTIIAITPCETTTTTTTSTTTAAPLLCYEWNIYNGSLSQQLASWVDCCSGDSISELIDAGNAINVCSRTEPNGTSLTITGGTNECQSTCDFLANDASVENVSSEAACSDATSQILYTAAGTTFPNIGVVFYTDSSLETPYVGSEGWISMVWQGTEDFLQTLVGQINASGEVVNQSFALCGGISTTTTTTTTTAAPVGTSTTTTTTTEAPVGTSTTTSTTTAAPVETSTTTSTTTEAPVETSTTTSTTTEAPVETSTTTSTTTEAPVETSTTTSTTTEAPVETSTTTSTTTEAPIETSTTTTTTTIAFFTFNGVQGKTNECCPTPIDSINVIVYSNCDTLALTTCGLYQDTALTTPVVGRFTYDGVCYETDVTGTIITITPCATTTTTTTTTTEAPTTTSTTTTTTTAAEFYYTATQYLNCVQNGSVGGSILFSATDVTQPWVCGDDGFQYEIVNATTPQTPDANVVSSANACISLVC